MHGKISEVHHTSTDLFSHISVPFKATRYHSLVIGTKRIPDCLDVTAWTTNKSGGVDEIMGVKHRSLPIAGVQFHPESIMTEHGHKLLQNFLGFAGV